MLAGCNAQHRASLDGSAPDEVLITTIVLPTEGPLAPIRPDFGDRVAAAATPAQPEALASAPATASGPSGDLVRAYVGSRENRPISVRMASVQGASFNAYEDRIARAADPGPLAPGGNPVAGGAVIEVNGARVASVSAAAASAQPAPPQPRGRAWRPAYPHVRTACFDPSLRRALDTIGRHFRSEVLVTSGFRTNGRRRSLHRQCRAADIRVAGVAPSAVARFARTVPGINGVGTYRRRSIVHIDTRQQMMVWRY